MPFNDHSTSRISTYIVDDHPVIRDAVRDIIEEVIDMEVCGETGCPDVAFREIGERRPDVIIVDISLEDGHGLDLVQKVRAHYPTVRALVFSNYDETVYAERAIRSGAAGYVMKDQPLKNIPEAIRTATDGDVYLSRSMASRVLGTIGGGNGSGPTFAIDELTEREMTVFEMLGQGYSIEEIRDRLGLAQKTVEAYRRRAKEKLGIDTVSELLQYAVQWTYGQGTRADKNGNGTTKHVAVEK